MEEVMHIHRVDVLLDEPLAQEVLAFWAGIFPDSAKSFRQEYAGQEADHNRDTLYLARIDGRLVGTTRLTVGLSTPSLGGLGEVATSAEARGQGVATALCTQARDDFFSAGGLTLFLATSNPNAARIYQRLLWRRFGLSDVFACLAAGQDPDEFLRSYYATAGRAVEIVPGSPAFRIPMIPLIVAPHDWRVLDANVNIFSTRYACQTSCMRLYPRYAARGAWFAARAATGQTVGLASVCRAGAGEPWLVDGFAHADFIASWEPLFAKMIAWAAAAGASRLQARCAVEDGSKRAAFAALGFAEAGPAAPFTLDGREVPALLLEGRASGGH
jgi:ribosomal protein S18 acetylase RimI-like enzyme